MPVIPPDDSSARWGNYGDQRIPVITMNLLPLTYPVISYLIILCIFGLLLRLCDKCYFIK
jgi:hypothetical protein